MRPEARGRDNKLSSDYWMLGLAATCWSYVLVQQPAPASSTQYQHPVVTTQLAVPDTCPFTIHFAPWSGRYQAASRPREGPSPPDAVQFRKGRVNLLRPRQRTAGHTGGSSCPSA